MQSDFEKEVQKFISAGAKPPGFITDPRVMSKATARGHIHIPGPRRFKGGVPKTHAWYRRHKQVPPTRRSE